MPKWREKGKSAKPSLTGNNYFRRTNMTVLGKTKFFIRMVVRPYFPYPATYMTLFSFPNDTHTNYGFQLGAEVGPTAYRHLSRFFTTTSTHTNDFHPWLGALSNGTDPYTWGKLVYVVAVSYTHLTLPTNREV